MANVPHTRERHDHALTAEQALAIAQANAVQSHGDLSGYCIHLTFEDDGWHVEYDLKDPRLKGGGPRYLIDPLAGAIISKTYEQ